MVREPRLEWMWRFFARRIKERVGGELGINLIVTSLVGRRKIQTKTLF